MKFTAIIFLGLSLIICSFSMMDSQAPREQDPINPNGSSELALLMRAMFDEGMKMKEGVLNGEKVELELDYEKMLTSKATEPEKAASPAYEAFSEAFIDVMEEYKKADFDKSKALYLDMVSTCRSCHKFMCPGPLVRIDLLDLDNIGE